jgi:hypothetical protein
VIDSICSASCFLNYSSLNWGYWLPLLSVEKIGPFPVYVYSYTIGPSRPIWFGGTIRQRLSVLKNVVSRSSYYLYEVAGDHRYSCEMTFSSVIDCWLGCVEEFLMRRSR